MDNLTLAYVLIGFGLAFLLAELFLPTGGILFVIAAGCVLTGTGMAFFYGDQTTGILTLAGVFVAVPIVAMGGLYLWPHTPMGRRLKLIRPSGEDDDATVAAMPVNVELESLRGKFGTAVSVLRPSGVAEFDGRRIDVLTEGVLVERGTTVRCIDVKAGKVFVRPVERPRLTDLENADFS